MALIKSQSIRFLLWSKEIKSLVILEIVMSRQGSSHTCYRALLCQNILPSQKRKLLVYAMVAQIILPKIMALLHFHSSEYVSPKQAANMNGEL